MAAGDKARAEGDRAPAQARTGPVTEPAGARGWPRGNEGGRAPGLACKISKAARTPILERRDNRVARAIRWRRSIASTQGQYICLKHNTLRQKEQQRRLSPPQALRWMLQTSRPGTHSGQPWARGPTCTSHVEIGGGNSSSSRREGEARGAEEKRGEGRTETEGGGPGQGPRPAAGPRTTPGRARTRKD